MSRFAIVSITLLFLLISISPTGASDLAEAAKKEKARREALKKEGKEATVLTNADVANIKSNLGIEVTESAKPAEEPPDYLAPYAEDSQAEEPSAEEKNAKIDKDIKSRKEEIDEINQEIEERRANINEAGTQSANIGSQYRSMRESEELIQELEKDIDDLQAKKEQEGEDEE